MEKVKQMCLNQLVLSDWKAVGTLKQKEIHFRFTTLAKVVQQA